MKVQKSFNIKWFLGIICYCDNCILKMQPKAIWMAKLADRITNRHVTGLIILHILKFYLVKIVFIKNLRWNIKNALKPLERIL